MTRVHVTLIASLLLVCPLLANAQEGPGCGPANVKFDISTTKKQPLAPALQAGKAFVYFLQDDLKYNSSPRPTTRFGLDGAWVGATHANSYFYVAVDPGEHQVCANWQSDTTGLSWIGPKRSTAAAEFTAEAGKSYYFRAEDIARRNEPNGPIISEPEVRLAAMEPAEAQVLVNSFSLSSSHPKK